MSMYNTIEPRIRSWYQRSGEKEVFQVVAVDDDEALIELQHYDGDVEELTLDEWREMDIEVADPPEDFAGALDDADSPNQDFSETRSEGERRGQRQDQRRRNLQGDGSSIAGQRIPGRPIAAEGEEGAAAAVVSSGTEEPRSGPVSPAPADDVRRRLRDRSEELRADIERELRKYDEETLTMLADRVADPGEQSVSTLLEDVNIAEVTRDLDEIRDIDLALQRLAEGNYGTCMDCGGEIEPRRLEARPEATRCIECQRKFENRDRREHHRTL